MALSLLYKNFIAQSEINVWVIFSLFKQTVAALTIAAFCQAVSRNLKTFEVKSCRRSCWSYITDFIGDLVSRRRSSDYPAISVIHFRPDVFVFTCRSCRAFRRLPQGNFIRWILQEVYPRWMSLRGVPVQCDRWICKGMRGEGHRCEWMA